MADHYRDLIAWRKATELALFIYRSTKIFPKDETYGLTSQMQRAAVSVASNIAEGKGCYSKREFVQFLYRARGSLTELETQLFIARELEYLDEITAKKIENLTIELGRILSGLITSVAASANKAS